MLYRKYKYLSVSIAAVLAVSGAAFAADVCDLSDGFEQTLIGFNSEAEACLEGVDGLTVQSFVESEIRRKADTQRDNGAVLLNLASLNEAARLHAFDMATRGFIAHADLEGRGHADRLRMLERKRLIGATGANMVILSADATPEAVFEAIISDTENARNMTRDSFTHMGIGAVEAEGRLYVVQLFARVDGELDQAVPLTLGKRTDLRVSYADANIQSVGWRLENTRGGTLARGNNPQIVSPPAAVKQAGLSVDVTVGSNIYTLKGPIISTQ